MIVVMNANCSEAQIAHVLEFLEHHSLTGHPSKGVERTVIGILGSVGPTGIPNGIGSIQPELSESLEGLPGVESVLRVSKPYKLASREYHPQDTIVKVPSACVDGGFVHIGGVEI